MVFVLSSVGGLLGDLDHIVVVGTGHALVGGDHNIAFFSILRRQIGPLVKKAVTSIRRFHQDLSQSVLHGEEVRLRILQGRAGL